MTDVLILGGSGWLSGLIAERWLDRGARVTAVARGGRPVPYGATLVRADRAEPDAYVEVAAREWDEVVDISSTAEHVREALAAIGPHARHWTFVSTISVYAPVDRLGADESAPLVDAVDDAGETDAGAAYARAKASAEASVRDAVGGRAAIVRPGLIVGPGDPTDRFGYWAGRFALAADGPVLIPVAEDRGAQVIDARDVADFVVSVGDARWVGTANAVGEPRSLADVLALSRRIAAHTGEVVAADDEWLLARDVGYWMGPRSLPLWLPPDMPGFSALSHSVYTLLGGRLRDLRTTIEDVLADERTRGLDRARRSGLTREEESALLGELTQAP